MSNLLSQASLVMIPSGYKEDVVYSAIPTNGNGDLSFTRASNGTRVNSAGLVEVVPWNLVGYSNDFSSNWSLVGSSKSTGVTDPIGNSNSIKLKYTTANSGHYITQGITLTGSNAHSVYAKAGELQFLQIASAQSINEYANFNLSTGAIGTYGSLASNVQIENVGNGWYRCSVVFTSGSNGIYLAIVQSASSDWFGVSAYAGSNNTDGLYLYGGQLNTGALKPYFPTTDRLNVPRLTYQNGGGGCPSLLLEKQSTNLFTYSEQFDNAAWTKSSGSVTANQAISPDGTQNADLLVGEIYQQPTFANATTYSFSVFAKKESGSTIYLGYIDNVTGFVGGSITYTYSTGVVAVQQSANGSVSGQAIDMGNGWIRVIMKYTTITVVTFNYQYIGSAGSYVWGAQTEVSTYPTSYIPTTSSSATRVADYPSRSGLALTNFTFAVNFKPLDYVVELFDFEKTGGGRMFYIAVQSSGFITFNSVSGGTIGAVGSVLPKNQTCKLAFSLNASTSNLKIYINGSIIGTYATNITTFGAFFGLQNFGYNPGTQIEQIAIFPSVLTDAECQSLTTI